MIALARPDNASARLRRRLCGARIGVIEMASPSGARIIGSMLNSVTRAGRIATSNKAIGLDTDLGLLATPAGLGEDGSYALTGPKIFISSGDVDRN